MKLEINMSIKVNVEYLIYRAKGSIRAENKLAMLIGRPSGPIGEDHYLGWNVSWHVRQTLSVTTQPAPLPSQNVILEFRYATIGEEVDVGDCGQVPIPAGRHQEVVAFRTNGLNESVEGLLVAVVSRAQAVSELVSYDLQVVEETSVHQHRVLG
jgi:hypothetical protein